MDLTWFLFLDMESVTSNYYAHSFSSIDCFEFYFRARLVCALKKLYILWITSFLVVHLSVFFEGATDFGFKFRKAL